jgi:hypothetical protein
MDDKRIDSHWGARGLPPLPKSLRDAWDAEPLPPWIAAEFGLPAGSTAAALRVSIWESSSAEALTDRQRHFLLNLVSARRWEIRSIPVFAQPVPYWLDLKSLPLSTRTRNCLISDNLLGDKERLSSLTFADLFEIRSMGVVSILELACTVEAALERSTAGVNEVPGLTEHELSEIVAEDWADQVGPADPRFSDLLPALPQATILEMLDALTSAPDNDAAALSQLSKAVPELRKRLEQIAALPLEDQLGEFLHALSRFDGARLSALVDRLGWGGKPCITLEEAGERLGVTRERMRQLQEKVSGRFGAISFPVFMPALDEALRALAEASPISVGLAAMLLKQKGISATEFHPESVIAAAVSCGRKPPIRLQTVKKGRTIVTAAAIRGADAILGTAYRQAHASGASNVSEVVAEMTANNITVDDAAVRYVLREVSDVQFLEQEWFCHRPTNPERDRLRNVTRKILSVASPIELGVIREGVRREYRYRGHRGIKTWSLLVPPRSVLRAYYDAHPEFIVENGDMVKSSQPLDYRVELALNDAILVDVLRSSPACVLDRASFATECIRRSMNVNTFNMYLSYSPVILHLDTDVWSLRGVRVDPAAVEAVRAANAVRQKEKRVLDHGWAPEGQLWLAARIPAAADAASLVVGVPGPIRHYLSGRQFDARDEDGVSHGSVRVNNEGASYGFTRFLRQRGADEGDILIAEFDLTKSVALLRLGDDELLEEMSPEA